MAKKQQRGNRETKKPKQKKQLVPAASVAGSLAARGGTVGTNGAAKKR